MPTEIACTTTPSDPPTVTQTVDVVVTNPDSQTARLVSGFTFVAPVKEISNWRLVDSGGINWNPYQSAYSPQLVDFNNKLYALWDEFSTQTKIRAKSFNGDDYNPWWTSVDGNGPNGINYHPDWGASYAQPTVFNSKLYATWQEYSSGVYQAQVAVFKGAGSVPPWSPVNGPDGIARDPTQRAFEPQITVFNSKLYATWSEGLAPSNFDIRVAVYNGNDSAPVWTSVDGGVGLNKDPTKNGFNSQLTVFNSKLYATWIEANAAGDWQTRVRVYNGNDGAPAWTFVDGNGANGINTVPSSGWPQLTAFNSKLYAALWEYGDGILPQIRVRVYNGNDSSPAWTSVDGGAKVGGNSPQLTVYQSKLYWTWDDGNGVRVFVYNGNDGSPAWTPVDGGGLWGATAQLTVCNFKLYLIWYRDSQIRVAVGE